MTCAFTVLHFAIVPWVWGANGELTLSLVDAETGNPVAARVVLRRVDPRNADRADSAPLVKPPKSIPAGVGVAVDGTAVWKLPEGTYRFEIIRGPEHRVVTGSFQILKDSVGAETIKLPRFVNMVAEGWVAGDLLVQNDPSHLDVLMRAEDLHAVAMESSAKTNRIDPKGADAGRPWKRSDLYRDRQAQGLALLGPPHDLSPLQPSNGSWELIPAAMDHGGEALCVVNPTDWDLPFWLASGKVGGFAVLHPEVRLDRRGKWLGREPNEKGYLNDLSYGTWAERVWRYALEAGFRIPAVAASGSSAQGNPLGYNRVYVHCEDPNNPNEFWQGLWQGRSVVTNGPLMRPLLGGSLPGETIRLSAGNSAELAPDMRLAVRDAVSYMDVIYNDRVLYSARLDEAAKRGAPTPQLHFDASGWVIMRVVTDVEDHWRAAVTSPWWIDVEGQPRISRQACLFFQQWLEERIAQLAKGNPASITAATPYVKAARAFWKQRLDAANVE